MALQPANHKGREKPWLKHGGSERYSANFDLHLINLQISSGLRRFLVKLLRTLVFVVTSLCAWNHATQAGEKADVPWVSLAKRNDIHLELKSNGRDQVTAV